MALVPTVWLALRRPPHATAWWWLSGVFLISWLADTAADLLPVSERWVASMVYPVSQAAMVGMVFLVRGEAALVLAVLLVAGLAGVLWEGPATPGVLLRTVAWGTAAGIVLDRPALGRLRTALLATFGVGLLAWYGYVLRPGWASWVAYQSVRAAGIGLFCWASLRPGPQLQVFRHV